MKNKYKNHAESAFIVLIAIIVMLVFLAAQQCKAQSISVGTGVVSTGQWVSKITARKVVAGQWGFGLKGIDQDLSDDKPQHYTFEMHQWSISLIYSPVYIQEVSFYVGGGKGKSYDIDCRQVEPYCYTTAELGFMYRLVKPRYPEGRFSLYVDACMDSYSGLNVTGLIEVKIF